MPETGARELRVGRVPDDIPDDIPVDECFLCGAVPHGAEHPVEDYPVGDDWFVHHLLRVHPDYVSELLEMDRLD